MTGGLGTGLLELAVEQYQITKGGSEVGKMVKMTDAEKRLRRGLEIGNLVYALLRGWNEDPRWLVAVRRVLREQEARDG